MQALRTGRVNHAYLFSGPRGCGKTTSARILARCLNCEQGPTPTPCGSCDSCVALARGGPGSVDVIEIDAASHGGVDDARDLRERASYGPAQSRFKIYIIDEAHMVTPQGFNALLKIVEEPPEHVKFVFATTEPEKVIGTIRSRTHHYPFRLVPPGQLTDYMQRLCDSEGVSVAPGCPVVRDARRGWLGAGLAVRAGPAHRGFGRRGTDLRGCGRAAGVHRRRAPRRHHRRLRGRRRCRRVPPDRPRHRDRSRPASLRRGPARAPARPHRRGGGAGRRVLGVAGGARGPARADAPAVDRLRLRCALAGGRHRQRGAHRDDRGDGPEAAARAHLRARPAAGSLRRERVCRASRPARASPRRRGGAVGGATSARPGHVRTRECVSRAHRAAHRARAHRARCGGSTSPTPEQEAAAVATPEPSPAAPAPSPASQPAAPAAAATPEPPRSTGGIDTAAIRRAWPDILGWIFKHKRTTWTLLSEHATVHEFDGSKVVLGISTVGIANTFRHGPHADLVRQALIDVLGVDARVEGIPTPGAPAPSVASHWHSGLEPRPVGSRAALSRPQAPPTASNRPVAQADRSADSAPSFRAPESGDDGWASAASGPDSGPSWAAGPDAEEAVAPTSRPATPARGSPLQRARAEVAAEAPAGPAASRRRRQCRERGRRGHRGARRGGAPGHRAPARRKGHRRGSLRRASGLRAPSW